MSESPTPSNLHEIRIGEIKLPSIPELAVVALNDLLSRPLFSKTYGSVSEKLTKLPTEDILTLAGHEVRISSLNSNERRLALYVSTEKKFIEWMMAEVKNKVVWDIGSGEGVYSILAVKNNASKVVAFEPDVQNRESLIRNLNLNLGDKHNITVEQKALWSENVPVTLETSGTRGDAPQIIGKFSKGKSTRKNQVVVEGVRMDKIIESFGKPDLVKIDVEGAELDVLQGMGEFRPQNIFLELHLRSSSVNSYEVGKLLGNNGYEVVRGYIRGNEALIQLRHKNNNTK